MRFARSPPDGGADPVVPRYWVTDLHVDGSGSIWPPRWPAPRTWSTWAPVLSAMTADPVLSQVKLIAEPWDIGIGGYQAGNFPQPWAEWNDVFRGTVRDTWRSIVRCPNSAHG